MRKQNAENTDGMSGKEPADPHNEETGSGRKNKKKGRKTGLFTLLCAGLFIVSFVASNMIHKAYQNHYVGKYSVDWSDEIGTVYTDMVYGEGEANKFDLYVPADHSRETYGLIVYLHAGGFTTGDKSGDADVLKYYCSLGYVTAGINYTLRTDNHPEANVYTQSMEIKEAVPYVVEKAKELGYNCDRLCLSGGSAGGCLALIYAYRDAADSPIPVKMVFEGVGPSSFYPEDWKCYGADKNVEVAAGLFGVMRGETVDPAIFGTEEYDELMKPISALLWVDENTVPTVLAYGKYDKVQPYEGAVRLDARLTEAGVEHTFIVCEHSGHGLQNDSRQFAAYYAAVEEYLGKYMSE